MNPASLTTSGAVTTNYSFVVSDTDGPGDLQGVDVLFGESGNPFCWFFFDRGANQVSIYDADNQWVYATIGQGGAQGPFLYGKDCSINAQAATVSTSGNNLTLNIPITLAGLPNFECTGSCVPSADPVYMNAITNAGVDTHYQKMGTWTPTSDTSPFFGLGASPTYTYPNGGKEAYSGMRAGGSISYTVTVTDSSGFDAPLNFTAGPTPNGSEVTATISPTTLTGSGTVTVTLSSLSSAPPHAGVVTITASTSDNSISASVPVFYTLDNAPPMVSMKPTTLSGSSATPEFLVGDATSSTIDIPGVDILINSTLNGQGACWMWYDNETNYIWLANDDASSWNGMILNSNNTLQNSQCIINGSGSVAASGNSPAVVLGVDVNITLKPGFSGVKMIYERAPNQAGFDSDYQQVGTWTAP